MNGRMNTTGQRLERRPAPRGASRVVTPREKTKRSWVLPRINWGQVRRGLAASVTVALLAGAVVGWQALQPMLNQPIARIAVSGEVSSVNQAALQESLTPYVEANFFTVDIRGIQQLVEELPWVDQVHISRIWPNQLELAVTEHQPVARWGEQALLNNSGRVFIAERALNTDKLPLLHGPQHTEERVMRQYWSLTQVLRPLGYNIERLEMRERGSWFLTTQAGVEFLLGRDEIVEKMRRFVVIYEQELKGQMDQVARIDLRYTNGLAVTWRPNEAFTAAQ